MANVAIIFAGGTGTRMRSGSTPKQFLKLDGKPILIYTLELFDTHPQIDGIIVVVLEHWLKRTKKIIEDYRLDKVVKVLAGGKTAIESQRIGIEAAAQLYDEDDVLLIHDGVRPLIDHKVISDDIACVLEHGSAITTAPAIETIVIRNDDGVVGQIVDRTHCELARAPQCFRLGDILSAHRRLSDGETYIDSASMMQHFGYSLYTVVGPPENIKITTPNDFYTFRALMNSEGDVDEDV